MARSAKIGQKTHPFTYLGNSITQIGQTDLQEFFITLKIPKISEKTCPVLHAIYEGELRRRRRLCSLKLKFKVQGRGDKVLKQ